MYKITVTDEQAAVIRNALEFYARMGMGQFTEILHLTYRKDVSSADRQDARELLDRVHKLLTKLPANAYNGILQDEVDDFFRVAWEVMQTIRHRLAWDECPEGNFQYVRFDAPYKMSKDNNDPLPTIERVEDGNK